MALRGIRGATTTNITTQDEILARTRELLEAMLQSNPGLTTEDIGSVVFTTTADLTTVYPAVAARQMGWSLVPMMCAQESPIVDSLPQCIRVLIHWNTEKSQAEIRHVYLHEAALLRPDLCK